MLLCLYAASKSIIYVLNNLKHKIAECRKSQEPNKKKITKKLTESLSTARDIIPFIVNYETTIEKTVCHKPNTSEQLSSLLKDYEKEKGVISYMMQTMKAKLKRRFSELESENIYKVEII